MIIALTVPLAINLRERAQTELIGQALVTAQAMAAVVGAEALAPARRDELQARATDYSEQIDGRVLILDADGIVLADANPFPLPSTSAVGENYDTQFRPEIQTALHQGQPDAQIRDSQDLGTDIMVAAAPIIDDRITRPAPENRAAGVAGAVRITFEVQSVTDAVRNVTLGILVIGLGGLLAGMLIAFGLAGSLARPLSKLARTARLLGDGDLTARAGKIRGPREIEELATSFDEMADRVERTFEAQRSFVANASHQLRTPLTGMKLRIERAADESQDPELRRQLQAADREVDRMAATIDRMLDMAQQIEEGQPTSVDLHAAATAAVERWSDRAAARSSELHLVDDGTQPFAHANPNDIGHILDNLIDNAIAYAPGSIDLLTERRDGRVLLAVRDHGPGIADEERESVTERFYRGKGSPPGGSGLGLAIARDLAQKWGGELQIRSAPEGGTQVETILRAAPPGGIEA